MPDNPNLISQRIALQGGEEIKKQLSELGDVGERAFKQIEQATAPANETLAGLSRASAMLHETFRKTGAAIMPVVHNIQELHQKGVELGHQFTELADRIFPHFKEILTLAIAGSAYELLKFVQEASAATRETDNMAKTLGYSTETFEGLRMAAANAGVDQGRFTVGLGRMSVELGKAREEQMKLTGEIAGSVPVLRGGMALLAGSSIALHGSMSAAAAQTDSLVNVVRGGIKPVMDFSNPWKTLRININDYADTQKGNTLLLIETAKRLSAMGDSAVKAATAQQLMGRSWRENMPALINLGAALAEAQQKIEHFGIGIEDEERNQSRAFNRALAVFQTVSERIKTIVGNIFGQAFVPVLEAMTEFLGKNNQAIRLWAATIAEAAKGIVEDFIRIARGASRADIKIDWIRDLSDALVVLGAAARGVGAALLYAFRGLVAVLTPVVNKFNELFGTHFTAQGVILAGVILKITGIFGILASTLSFLWTVGTTIVSIFIAIGTAIGAVAAVIGWPLVLAVGILALITYLQGFEKTWKNIHDGFQGTWDLIKALAAWIGDTFVMAWNNLTDAIQKAIDAISKFLGLSSKSEGGAGAAGPTAAMPFAAGGRVYGPSGTDTVPIRATAGEYVMSLRAVSRYGLGLMNAINSLSLPPIAVPAGGPSFPAPPSLRYASGGPVPASHGDGRPFHLTIEGQTFRGLSAPAGEHERLFNFARRKSMVSAGKKPSWAGSG